MSLRHDPELVGVQAMLDHVGAGLRDAAPHLWAKQIARSSDPSTSHASARELTGSGERARMMGLALETLTANPGKTAKELERLAGQTDGAVRKRLNDLLHAGQATHGPDRKCSITGRMAQTWLPLPAGGSQ